MAYEMVEPFDREWRADLRMGTLASVIVNVNRGKHGKAAKPSDFMPKFTPDPPSPAKSNEELFAIVVELNKALGGKDLRPGMAQTAQTTTEDDDDHR